jgi:hypothetical protein
MSMSEKTIIDFVREELERLRQERLERLGGDLLRIEDGGIYLLELDVKTEFKRIKTRYGERVVIPVIHNGEPRVLMVNPSGKLYRMLIEQISEAVKKVRDVTKITKFAITISRFDKYHYKVSVTPVL